MKTRVLRITGIVIGSLVFMILTAFGTYVYQYYPRKAEPFEISPDNPSRTILLAVQSSEFKDELVRTLCDSLKPMSVHIRGIDVPER